MYRAPESVFIPATRSRCRSSRLRPTTAFVFSASDLGGLESARDRHASGRHSVADRPHSRSGVGRDGRAPARRADRARHRQRHCRAEQPGSADHGRQRRAVRVPDSERSGRQEIDGAQEVPEGPPADLPEPGRQAHRALSVGPLQGHLQHQLRPPAHPASVADDEDHRRDVRRGDRAGADVRVPEGSRDAAPARPRARRLARQRDRPRRDRRRSTTRCASRTSSSATRSST